MRGCALADGWAPLCDDTRITVGRETWQLCVSAVPFTNTLLSTPTVSCSDESDIQVEDRQLTCEWNTQIVISCYVEN